MMIHHPFRAMGCEMLALLDSDRPIELAQVPAWFEEWEQQFSRFRDTSELSRLNQNPGAWTAVSDDFWAVLDLALQAADQTNGLVTPTMLAALEAIGYNQTFVMVGADGTARLTATPPPPQPESWRLIGRDHVEQAVLLPPGLRLDFGGVAKGWAADRAARRAESWGPVLVDAGGDIAVSGPLRDGSPWIIAVADPNDPANDLELLALTAGGVATSGRDYRRWRQGGEWVHHILDPRTGRSATTDVLSATVVGPSASAAEVAAKTALILGSRDGLRWIEARPELAALLVLDNQHIIRSKRFGSYIAP